MKWTAIRYELKNIRQAFGSFVSNFLVLSALLVCTGLFVPSAIGQISLPAANHIDTIAGDGTSGYDGDGALAIDAQLTNPTAVAIDHAGNVYIADTFNSVVRKISVSTGIITTAAGNGTQGYTGDGGPATSAQLNTPWGIAIDAAGNIYIGDTNNGVIRKVDATTHAISTIAGTNGQYGCWGDGGPATGAAFKSAWGLATDSAGNLYVSDFDCNLVRKISASTGYISTVAGNGSAGSGGNGGLATSAELNGPAGIFVDASGNLYIADSNNNVIRKVAFSTGVISAVAGNGTAGYSGDSGPATSAKINSPAGIVVDAASNLCISDNGNNVLRRVSSSGTITTLAGTGTADYAGDGGLATAAAFNIPMNLGLDAAGNIYVADYANNAIRAVGSVMAVNTRSNPTITWAAPAAITYGTALNSAQLNATANVPGTFAYWPVSATILPAGLQTLNVVFTPTDNTTYSPEMATVQLVVHQAIPGITWSTPAPIVYRAALGAAQLNATANIPGAFQYTPAAGTIPDVGAQTLSATFTPIDTIDYTTAVASVQLTVSTTPGGGVITTVAGDGDWGNGGDGGVAVHAELENPNAIAVDPSRNLYIGETSQEANVARKVNLTTGIITTAAGSGVQGYTGDGGQATSAELSAPGAQLVDSNGNLYIADGNNVIRKVAASTGIITTIVGNGTAGYSGDGGPATSAQLNGPWGMVFDASGNLYIADRFNGRIRKVNTSTGIITTVAGNGTQGFSGDGGAATSAKLHTPSSLAFDASSNLYIYDTFNNRIRKVNTSGIITTVAGTGTAGYSGDGGPATSAKMRLDAGLAVDSVGNIYIADSGNNAIRMVNPSGIITTIAGNGVAGYSGDSGPATGAELHQPEDVFVDALGNIFIADMANEVIREIGSTRSMPVAVSVSPATITLQAGQSATFTATVANTINQNVTWSISPTGRGSISANGLYTAPATVSSQQTATITATSQADPAKSATAMVTLMPTISVSVSPQSANLYGGQQKSFSASVTNTTNTAVTWSINPAGAGTIDLSGNYTAPETVNSQQAVTVTATSQADTSKSASALLQLLPPCNWNGFGFVRPIKINHGRVLNSDQANFPFLFSVTDPTLRTTGNGGHVTNANGYDLVFTSDSTGQSKLDFEVEEYNPVTGQLVAWVRIPALSHSIDTTLYLFYGNSSVTTSQQNPAAVWDSNYVAVWHLPNGASLSANDSTANGNNGTPGSGAIAATGIVDGAASLSGAGAGYISFPAASTVWTFAGDMTLSAWIKTTSNHALVVDMQNSNPLAYISVGPTTAGGSANTAVAYFRTTGGDVLVASGSTPVNDGQWHNIQTVRSTRNAVLIYVDGLLQTTTPYTDPGPIDIFGGGASIGYGPSNYALTGLVDEARISKVARSADWIATEYNNESSPSAFSTLGAESSFLVSPGASSLLAGQSQQFSTISLSAGSCGTDVIWSIPVNAPGTLTGNGLYSAPSIISAEQSITVTASSAANPSITATAVVTILPVQNPQLTLSASAQAPYVVGTSQQFTAKLTNEAGTPLAGFSVTFSVNGANNTSEGGTTDSNGLATFAYTGANSGNDTIEASTSAGGTQASSNEISAFWIVPASQISTTSASALFFPNASSSYTFDIPPTATPAFTQTFPNIIFNPPVGAIPGNTTVGVGSRPFTDVITDEHGNFAGTIMAGGNGYQPGVVPGNMGEFETVFNGSFVVGSSIEANGGNATISIYVDNSFILGIGGGATSVSGPGSGTSQTTPFQRFPVMGAVSTSIGGASLLVHFPGPGTYPYELDYVECCGGGGGDTLSLMMTAGAPNGSSATPTTATLTLSPNSLQPLPVGGQQAFTVLATDASGNPVSNLSVGFVVSYLDNQQASEVTDSTGHATFQYKDVSPGTASVQAVALIDGMVTYSNSVSVAWTLSPSTGTNTNAGDGSTLSISVSAPNTVILPATLPISASVSDSALPSGGSIALAWSQVSGPGTVTFSSPNSTSTTASFSEPGGYVLNLSATDPDASDSVQFTITVNPTPGVSQGWIGSPANGASVSGIVPITVLSGETLQHGTLTFYPANNPTNVTVLNANTTGSGQIGTLDTTTLANGQYWITLQANDTSGDSSYNLALVTVVGNYKPGRVTSTVTDLVVPAKGLAIQIQRTYDSLNAGTSGDFGYGWNLGTNVNLSVNPLGSVTFTLGGQRRTFYLTPQSAGFLPFYIPVFTPEPGLHGTLTSAGSGCSDFFDYLVPDGSLWACVGGGFWTPPGYVYIDPSGTAYSMTAGGQLQSIVDKNGNTLTITAAGITSSTGLSVPFARDSSGRITKITDPQGNEYLYTYDTHQNLASVTYPNTPQASTYTYDSNHRYLSGTDFRNNPLPTTTYYAATDTDSHGNPLVGRLESVSDGLGETTTYAYDLTTKTTTITYPPDAGSNVGTATMVYDTMGDLLTSTDPLGHTTTSTYDANQNLLSTTDPLNHITCYTYDANGNRTSVSLPQTGLSCSNVKSTTAYNEYSEPTQTIDELGNVRTFNYDVNFNPSTVIDSSGILASFIFNNDGSMQSGAIGFDISSSPSMTSQFTYDHDGNMASRSDALGRTTSYTYNSLGQKTSMVEPLPPGTSASAATTSYSHDAFGNLTQTAAPLGRTTSSTYDGNGNKLSDTDARTNITSYAYDALNRLTTTTYPTSPTTTSSKTYDFRGNVVSETDQAGHVTKHVYDLAGRQTSVTQAYGTSNATTTTYAYDNAGRKTSETDALGHATTYTYDAAGNLTGVSGVNGTFTYAYDNARNRVSMTDGDNNTTRYEYDARKRLVTTTYPDSTTRTNAYDGPGNLASVTDQNGNVVEYAYDAANQLQSVTQTNSPNAPNNVTSYGYSVLGDITGLTDANSRLTENAFDLLSQPVSKTLPDGSHTETRQYDTAGNLTSLTHFNGKTTTYTYDALNRLLSRTPDPTTGEHTVTFTYTATGKRASMTDASGTTNYTYDSMDRLITKATPEDTLNYTYDAAGHLASMSSSHTNGVSASYTYDSLNRLSTVVDARLTGNQTTTYGYDTASNVASVTYPNGVQYGFNYDELNRLKQIATSQTGYLYTFDSVGNRKTSTELNGRAVNWSFDGIYRLTGETITGAPGNENGTASYGPDPVGNRTSATSSIPGLTPVGGTFNADDELASESYDSDGNVTASGGKTFTYDTENHLMSLNGGAVSILYDGDGNRVAKTVSGVTTRYLVDDLNPTGYAQVVEELSSGGAVQRQYTYGLQRISQNQVISNTWTPSFYGYDGFGTVRQLTNSSGTITDTYDYDAFGNKINSTGTTPNSYLYRGEQYDSDLGLYYLRARYYNPLTGRFMSRDPEDHKIRDPKGFPIDPKALHKYLYANGDPVNHIDPTGRGFDEYLEEVNLDTFMGIESTPVMRQLALKILTCVANYLELYGTWAENEAWEICLEGD